MTAPIMEAVEPASDTDGEMAVTFPVVVLEHVETSDGRFLEAGSLSVRSLPISLLAQLQSAHGGDDPGPASVVGRIDTLVRTPGPEVKTQSGEPFPEGSFVWSGTGAISTTATIDGHKVADLVRRKFLRGVSVDLSGMDYDIVGDGELAADPEHPRRSLIVHGATIGAATLCPLPAFGDAYVEVTADTCAAPANLDDLPDGLVAAALPPWRSTEVGDPMPLTAAAPPVELVLPDDAADQLVNVIEDDGGEQRDSAALAKAIVEFVSTSWVQDPAEDAKEDADEAEAGKPKPPPFPPKAEQAPPAMADQPAGLADDPGPLPDDLVPDRMEIGSPDEPQPCALCGNPATHSLMSTEGDAFTPVCDDCDQAARDEITAAGKEVGSVVPIVDMPVTDQEKPA